jgi:uncharacterized protein
MAEEFGTGLQASRPTILVGGAEQAELAAGLLSLQIAEDTGGLYRCELRLGNWGAANGSTGFLYFDRRLLDFGKEIAVRLGADTLFEGRITALEAHFPEGQAPELSVLAEDRLQDLRMTRRTRTFADVSDADVMQRIAGDHGLATDLSVQGPTYALLAQVNQSDLAFLRDRARAVGAELWIAQQKLCARPRTDRGQSPLQLNYGAQLREFCVAADLAHQRTSLTVSGWDVSAKAELQHEAAESTLGGELNGDASGASVLASAFGQRREAVAHTVPLSSREAQVEAEALFRSAARRFVSGRGVAQPSARLRVGATVELGGLGPLFNGRYYLAEVRHVFDGAKGLRAEIGVERPGLGRAQ